MTQRLADRVKESWTGIGTGTITLGGAFLGFRTFASQYADADSFFYAIENPSAGEWEIGEGQLASSGTQLVRTTVTESSNSNLVVNFTGGIKLVYITPLAGRLATQTGQLTNTGVPFVDSRGQLSSNAGFIYATTTLTVQKIRATDSIGYPVGTGGTATQTGSKSAAVALSKITAEVTTHNASLAGNTNVAFTYTNSLIAAGDHVLVNHISGGTLGAYWVGGIAGAGAGTVTMRNVTAGSLAEALVLKISVLKAATT